MAAIAEAAVECHVSSDAGKTPGMHELQPASLDQQATDQTTEEPGQARTRSMLAKLKAFIKNPERKWSAGISSLVAALPALLLGLTLGYPSNAILDLTGEATELPEEFFFPVPCFPCSLPWLQQLQ
jgi:hypothetical protein